MNRLSMTLVLATMVAILAQPADALEVSRVAEEKNQSCQLISRNDAVNRAKAKAKGKILSVKLQRRGAKSVYKVRVLVGEKRIKNITIKACR